MFRVEYRFTGFGNWSTTVAPASAQGAWGQARAFQAPIRSDEVRIVPTNGQAPRLDLKV
jgi:hypothetical protein